MQDQGKRIFLFAILTMAVILVYNQFTAKPPPADGSGSAGSGSAVAKARPTGVVIGEPNASGPRGADERIVLTHPNLVATFSSQCGGLVGWKLTDARYARDAGAGQLLPDRERMGAAEATAAVPACGAFDVNFVYAGPGSVVPHGASWRGEQLSPTEVRYSYASDQLAVEKTFTLLPDKYLVRLAVKVTAKAADQHPGLAVSVYGYQDPAQVKSQSSSRGAAPRVWESSTLHEGKLVSTMIDAVLEAPRFESKITWTGFEHPFLLVGIAPRLAEGEVVSKQTFASDGKIPGLPAGFMRTDLIYPPVALRAGDALNKELVGYLGPKNYDDLGHADEGAGFPTGFGQVIDLGWFAFIGRPLLWLLQRFYGLFGNWGVSIILLTVVVKAATLYWTTKSMRSMKQMAALAPQMKALQAKYADDKQRQQQETMALYKEHGVNPIAGCLPMFLQMPIWLALYRMLSNVGELYQQPFIPGWINDLTATDPTYVLPIVLVVTMIAQTRLQPPSGDATQQKIMQWGIPLMFGGMSFWFASGLSLYFLTNTLLSAAHSIYMNKFDKQSLAIAEQMRKNQEAAAAKAAGKVVDGKAADGKAAAKAAAGKAGGNGKPTGKASDGDGKGEPAKPVARQAADASEDAGAPGASDGDGQSGGTADSGRGPSRKKRRR